MIELDKELTEKPLTRIQIQAGAALERYRRLGKAFFDFTSQIHQAYRWYKHCQVLASVLDRVASGELKRLMVFMPPRLGKSESVSRLFGAYYLFKHPTRQVGLCSYGADLAHDLSRSAMDNYLRTGRGLNPEISAASRWQTLEGGEMWASGVGGPITGKGFHLGIIDDPVKDQEEALSYRQRETKKDWYRSVFYTRREPEAAIILIQTRWHEGDLAGWLLEEELREPQSWHIVNFEAIKTSDPFVIPPTCTLEPDWRENGQALCPERFNEEALRSIKATVGEVNWASMYQQRPSRLEGDIWQRKWFDGKIFDDAPKLHDAGYDWDLAYTQEEKNSACAYIKSGRDGQGNVYVLGAGFDWKEFPEQIDWMKVLEGPHFIEGKASGKSAKQTLVKAGVAAQEVSVQGGDKEARARLVSPEAQTGRVYLHRSIADMLLNDHRQGIIRFPNSTHNDLNDAFVQALNRHKRAGQNQIRVVCTA